jgi:hypothetical protein
VIVSLFDTPAPPAPLDPPTPPLIVPPTSLVSDPIVAVFKTPAPPAPVKLAPAPPLILPLLVSVVIAPAFDTPAPPGPPMRPGPKPPFPPLIWPLFVSVMIAPALETPAPPGALLVAPPFPPMIVPLALLARDPIVTPFAFDTPTPPGAPAAPPAPLIDPLFISVETEQVGASTPSGLPAMEPLLVTVIAPPLLRTGPPVGVEMVWGVGTQARATSGAPNAASAISEAPASSAALKRPSFPALVKADGSDARASLEVSQVLIGLMTRPP